MSSTRHQRHRKKRLKSWSFNRNKVVPDSDSVLNRPSYQSNSRRSIVSQGSKNDDHEGELTDEAMHLPATFEDISHRYLDNVEEVIIDPEKIISPDITSANSEDIVQNFVQTLPSSYPIFDAMYAVMNSRHNLCQQDKEKIEIVDFSEG